MQTIYCIPGMGANSLIFKKLDFGESYRLVFLEWEMPQKNESLEAYAERFSKKITEKKPILLGVSFGGVLVQEIAKLIDYECVILISSVKNVKEFSFLFKMIKFFRLYRILPFHFLFQQKKNKIFFKNERRFVEYCKYMTFTQTHFLKWAIKELFLWKNTEVLPKTIHIQGDNDIIFPSKYIKNAVILEKSTHILIINRYNWLNRNLPKLIKEIY